MARLCMSLCAVILCLFVDYCSSEAAFDQNYYIDWGAQHFKLLDQGREAQILIDKYSGGGFLSKHAYGSGHFQMRIKIPRHSKAIVTTFYLSSYAPGGEDHDELDFELLGNNGPPYILHTNVFTQDSGHREQQFKLWFDPTADFHNYEILWNSKQVVFYADKIPIRVFKNNRRFGEKYPMLPMNVHATVWNGSQWLGSTSWQYGPFYANYRSFDISACTYDNANPKKCKSLRYPWNQESNWRLSGDQRKIYKKYKEKYIVYDYCKSTPAAGKLPECRE